MPEISVVIPSYNHSSYIDKAVESVLNQTFDDLELVIVDDGSTDNTLEILEVYSDPRLKIFSQENLGAHAAINRGLELAEGKLLAVLNSDDFYHPKRLEKAVDALRKTPQAGLVSSYIQIVDQNNHPIGIKHGYQDYEPWPLKNAGRSFRVGSELKDVLLTENCLATTSNFVFPRRCLEQVGGFRPLRFAHDWDFALRISRIADLVLLPEPLISYRIHPQNTIRKDQSAMIFEICWILAVHLPCAVADPDFLGVDALEKQIDQLLHSIYTFNCDRVLNMLLLMKLHEQPNLALKLLHPQNPIRTMLIEHIQEEKSRQSSSVSASGTQFIWATGLIRRLKKAFRKDLE